MPFYYMLVFDVVVKPISVANLELLPRAPAIKRL